MRIIKRLSAFVLTAMMLVTSMPTGLIAQAAEQSSPSVWSMFEKDKPDSTSYADRTAVILDDSDAHVHMTFEDESVGEKDFSPGDAVVIPYEVDDGYEISDFGVFTLDGKRQSVTVKEYQIEFTMPESTVKVYGLTNVYEPPTPDEVLADTDLEPADVTKQTRASKVIQQTEDYVKAHIDTQYISDPGDLTSVDIIDVRQSCFDSSLLPENIPDYTLDTLWGEEYLEESGFALLTQPETYVYLYDANPESDYVVGLVNTMIDQDTWHVTDWEFGKNDDTGNELEGAIYDESTGLLYVPKELLGVSELLELRSEYTDEEIAEMDVDASMLSTRVQLVQVSDGSVDLDNMSMDIGVTIESQNVSSDGLAKSGVASAVFMNNATVIRLTEEGKAYEEMQDLDNDDIGVIMNGTYLDTWWYGADAGVLYIPYWPGAIHDLKIIIKAPSLWDKIVGFFSTDANAVTIPEYDGGYETNLGFWADATPEQKEYLIETGNSMHGIGPVSDVLVYPSTTPEYWDSPTVLADEAAWRFYGDDGSLITPEVGMYLEYDWREYGGTALRYGAANGGTNPNPISFAYGNGTYQSMATYQALRGAYVPDFTGNRDTGSLWEAYKMMYPSGDPANEAKLDSATFCKNSLASENDPNSSLIAWEVSMKGGTVNFTKNNKQYKVELPGGKGNLGPYTPVSYRLACAHLSQYVDHDDGLDYAQEYAVFAWSSSAGDYVKIGTDPNLLITNSNSIMAVNMGRLRVLRVWPESKTMLIGITAPVTNTQAGVGTFRVKYVDKDIPTQPDYGGGLRIRKTAEDPSIPLHGAKFHVEIRDADGGLYKEQDLGPTNSQGYIVDDKGKEVVVPVGPFTGEELVKKGWMRKEGSTYVWTDPKYQNFTFTVTETACNSESVLNTTPMTGTIQLKQLSNGQIEGEVVQVNFANKTPPPVDVEFWKGFQYPDLAENNSFYSLADAEFRLIVYGADGEEVYDQSKTSASDGHVLFTDVPLGACLLQELSPTSSGTYMPATTSWEGSVTSDGLKLSGLTIRDGKMTVINPNPYGKLQVYKQDSDLHDNQDADKQTQWGAQGDASLTGARFKFYFWENDKSDFNYEGVEPLFTFEATTTDAWLSDDGTLSFTEVPGATKVAAVNLNKNGTIDQGTWQYRDDEIPDMTGFWEDGTGDFMWPEGTAGVEEIGMSEGYVRIDRIGYLVDGQIVDDAPNGGALMDGILLQQIEALDGPNSTSLHSVAVVATNEVIRGGFTVVKADKDRIESNNLDSSDPQGDGNFTGAQIAVINRSAKPVVVGGRLYQVGETVATVTMGPDGKIVYDPIHNEQYDNALPYGTYELKEVKAPDGTYHLNPDWSATFSIRKDGEVVEANSYDTNPLKEQIWRGGFSFQKVDGETVAQETEGMKPQGDATLAGATFDVYNESDEDVYVGGKWYAPGQVCFTFQTNDKGFYQSAADTLPVGKYYIREKSPSEGYLNNNEYEWHFSIEKDGEIVDLTDHFCTEQIIRGDVMIEKFDQDLNSSEAIGGYNHITEGYIDVEIPEGEESINVNVYKEAKADSEVAFTLTSTEMNKAKVTVLDYIVTRSDTVREGWYQISDDEGNKGWIPSDSVSIPMGAYLSGIQFEITNVSKEAVMVDGKLYSPGSRVAVITTKWEWNNPDDHSQGGHYVARTKDKALPYGTYEIRELYTTDAWGNKLANPSYKVTEDGAVKVMTFEIRKDGEVVSVDTEGNPLRWENEIVRGDIRFEKHAEDTSEPLETVWVITNKASGERHVVKTDKNGVYDSSSKYEGMRHSYRTNEMDKFLDEIDAGKSLKIDDVEMVGTWFGMGEHGDPANPDGGLDPSEPGTHWDPVDDTKGAFPYGEYWVQEVRTDSNEGYGLIGFSVYVWYDGMTVAGGTHDNQPLGIATTAVDKSTGIHTGNASRDAVIQDTVKFFGLDTGAEYKTKATLIDADTGEYVYYLDENREPVYITAEKSFTAEATEGTVVVELPCNGAELAGRNIVVFEELFDKEGNFLTAHRDQYDENQTVSYPSLSTTALSKDSNSHAAPIGEKITIVDTVQFDNLVPGYNYTLEGKAVDKSTGEAVKGVSAQASFMPKTESGTVDVVFEFDSTDLSGKTIVFYEKLLYEGQVIGTHEDINDEDQTVFFPSIGTEAVFDKTGTHTGYAVEDGVILDTVKYTGLVPGQKYELNAVLMDKASGEPVKVNDKQVTGTLTFVPDTVSGEVVVDIPVDATTFTGMDIVVFEELYTKDEIVAEHKDIEDEHQTVHFVGLKSNATVNESGIKETSATENLIVRDFVEYSNLIPGTEYKLQGRLVDPETSAVLTEKSIMFTPEEASGSVEIIFDAIDARNYANRTLVVTDVLYQGDTVVGRHEDLANAEQMIHVTNLRTTLLDVDNSSHSASVKENLKLVDKVEYFNLIPGEKYQVKGQLMNKTTGEPISDEVTVDFTPTESNGSVDVEFTIDASKLGGQAVVAFEHLYKNNIEIGFHADLNDEAQTVRFPGLSTVLSASDTGNKKIQPSENAMLTDQIQYSNLTPGSTYRVKGELYNKGTATPVEYNGEPVRQEMTFTPVTADGTVELKYVFDSSDMAGQYVVAFATIYGVGLDENGELTREFELISEKDLENADQTVKFVEPGEPTDEPDEPTTPPEDEEPTTPPEDEEPGDEIAGPRIRTEAVSKATGDHILELASSVIVVDTVYYEDLTPGEEYTITGVLMDKSSGSEASEEVSKTFVPTSSSGSVELEFKVDTTALEGHTLVAFETLTQGDDVIAEHKDLNDEDQSVYVAKIRTTATGNDGKSKDLKPSTSTVIIDTVQYSNLIPGVEYQLQGYLVNKATGDRVTDNVTMKFTPKSAGGSVQLKFQVDTKNMNGQSLVAFEYLYTGDGTLVAQHADVNDAAQTVRITVDGVDVNTGVGSSLPAVLGVIGGLLLVAAGAAVVYFKKKKHDE